MTAATDVSQSYPAHIRARIIVLAAEYSGNHGGRNRGKGLRIEQSLKKFPDGISRRLLILGDARGMNHIPSFLPFFNYVLMEVRSNETNVPYP